LDQISDSDADSRLSGLEGFLEFWFGPRQSGYGEPPDRLAAVQLPKPLRRFLAFAGRWPPARHSFVANRFYRQDRFLLLDPHPWASMHRVDDLLVFAVENQGVWEVATLPEGHDPGVWISVDCSHRGPHPDWRKLDRSLSHFLVSFVLQESLLGSDFVACHENAITKFRDAGCDIRSIWIEGEYAWPNVRHSYFLIEGRILLRLDVGDAWTDDNWYGFNDPEMCGLLEKLGLPNSIR
jgi:hypothetical protein